MKAIERREQHRLQTRNAILDATEALMREEGYAAVTSRRVGERANLKSQLVHYHFGSMDELFQEAFRRSDQRFFAKHLKALTEGNPLEAIWSLSTGIDGVDLVSEYVAAANHRKVLQHELVQSWAKFRALHTAIVARHMKEAGVDGGNYTPEILVFLVAAIGKWLSEESNLGFSEGHAEIRAFIKDLIGRYSPSPETARKPRKGRRKTEAG